MGGGTGPIDLGQSNFSGRKSAVVNPELVNGTDEERIGMNAGAIREERLANDGQVRGKS